MTFLATAEGHWVNQSGTVGPGAEVSINIEGHTDTGLTMPLMTHDCSRIVWNTGYNWCRSSVCTKPLPPSPPPPTPPTPPSYYALEWFQRDSKRILRNSLRTSPQYPWLMLYTGTQRLLLLTNQTQVPMHPQDAKEDTPGTAGAL